MVLKALLTKILLYKHGKLQITFLTGLQDYNFTQLTDDKVDEQVGINLAQIELVLGCSWERELGLQYLPVINIKEWTNLKLYMALYFAFTVIKIVLNFILLTEPCKYFHKFSTAEKGKAVLQFGA